MAISRVLGSVRDDAMDKGTIGLEFQFKTLYPDNESSHPQVLS